MKHHALSLSLALAALAAPLFPHSASAGVEVSFDYFQDALSPFGEWIEVADYGLCWRPTGVAEDWTPYTDGYWAYTDAGWTWVSYEDWGGITYHYGRWVHVLDEGWVWAPDYTWGPAWVSWRSSDDYVGWAPLPPEARWEENTGFSTWVDTSYDIGPDNYRFCHSYDFGEPVLAPLLLPCARNVTIIQTTVNVTNICYNQSSTVIFNGGLNFVNTNRHCRHQVPALKLVCEDRAPRDSHGHAPPQVLRGNQLAVFAPKVAPPADLRALPIAPRKIISADKINHGWSGVPDVAAQEQIRNKLGAQSIGLTPATAPARPVKAEELSHVPKQADPTAPPPNVIAKSRIVRPVESIVVKPQAPVTPVTPVTPQRPAPVAGVPRAVANRDSNRVAPAVNLPRVPEAALPRIERPVVADTTPRPVQPQPFNVPRIERPARPAQVAVAPAPVQPAPPQPVVTQDAQAAQRENELRNRQTQRVEAVRQQQEAQGANEARNQQVQQQRQQADIAARQQEAQRANEVRNQQVQQQRQQADIAARQHEAQRANEVRNLQVQQQRQQADIAARQQQAAQHANEARSQQMDQQREQARQANAARQQQEAAQHAAEFRNQQAQQAGSAQRANEMRNQQAQQIAVQRAAEMHQQHAAQAEAARRVQQPPPPQQVQPPPSPQQQTSKPSGKDGDDDKKKHR